MNITAKPSTNSFLIISTHDFRSPRKANIHFIAQELVAHGNVYFFSVCFSLLSKIKKDPRLSLWNLSNQLERRDGVDCYLWKSLLHPVNLEALTLSFLEKLWLSLYVRFSPSILGKWIREAQTIIIESGKAVAFFPLIKKINPCARIIYNCSDALETIGCSSVLIRDLKRYAPQMDLIRIPSQHMAPFFPKEAKLCVIPHGIDYDRLQQKVTSPYTSGINLISVGSMLFDSSFFEIAASAFPEITFHVIGGGKKATYLQAANIRVYDEMPFEKTLAYLKYAHAGIAPYCADKVDPYLADTSMKLIQYGAMGLPSICPNTTVGNYKWRFGYIPNDPQSITKAVRDALAFGRFDGTSPLTWSEVVNRMLSTENA